MSNIREKVARLLALSTSPNENEAKAALLKARELMAKHKLRPEEFSDDGKETSAVRDFSNVTCTKLSNPWAVSLACVIAEHYCCKAFTSKMPRMKTSTVGFVGLEDDFQVCKQIYEYAHDCVEARCILIREKYRKDGYVGATIREMCSAYGFGFCKGLKEAFDEQSAQHQEWGLALVTPRAVLEEIGKMKPSSPYGKVQTDGWRKEFADAGYQDGKKFDASRRLAEPEAPQSMLDGRRA